jgi:predicted RNA-binding Zn-ribbon protein involved in translation (DUF1610 family)
MMMDNDEFIDSIVLFMSAQQQAEEEGKKEFVCPLCGGLAWWGRAKCNNHLHSGCPKCGFKMME